MTTKSKVRHKPNNPTGDPRNKALIIRSETALRKELAQERRLLTKAEAALKKAVAGQQKAEESHTKTLSALDEARARISSQEVVVKSLRDQLNKAKVDVHEATKLRMEADELAREAVSGLESAQRLRDQYRNEANDLDATLAATQSVHRQHLGKLDRRGWWARLTNKDVTR